MIVELISALFAAAASIYYIHTRNKISAFEKRCRESIVPVPELCRVYYVSQGIVSFTYSNGKVVRRATKHKKIVYYLAHLLPFIYKLNQILIGKEFNGYYARYNNNSVEICYINN